MAFCIQVCYHMYIARQQRTYESCQVRKEAALSTAPLCVMRTQCFLAILYFYSQNHQVFTLGDIFCFKVQALRILEWVNIVGSSGASLIMNKVASRLNVDHSTYLATFSFIPDRVATFYLGKSCFNHGGRTYWDSGNIYSFFHPTYKLSSFYGQSRLKYYCLIANKYQLP